METLRLVLLFVHILGYAALLGGLLVQLRSETKAVIAQMRDGIGSAVLNGLLLFGVLESLGPPGPDHAKIGVKFAIGLVILVLVMVNMRKPSIPQGLYYGLLALTIVNIGVAVFWSPVHA